MRLRCHIVWEGCDTVTRLVTDAWHGDVVIPVNSVTAAGFMALGKWRNTNHILSVALWLWGMVSGHYHQVHNTTKWEWMQVSYYCQKKVLFCLEGSPYMRPTGDGWPEDWRPAQPVIIKAKSNTEEFKSTEIIYNPPLLCVKGEGCGGFKHRDLNPSS